MSNQKKGKDKLLIAAGLVFLCTFCITGYLLLDYFIESYQQKNLNEQLAALQNGTGELSVVTELGNVEDEMQQRNESENQQTSDSRKENAKGANAKEVNVKEANVKEANVIEGGSLSEINSDYVMWLQILDTNIDYPVVQKDNFYYLNHDFMGAKSNHGTIFLDENCGVEDRFLLLHGHHMKDGTMFGGLVNYKKADFRKEHTTLNLNWEMYNETYEIFAGALIDLQASQRFYYEELPQSEEEVKDYLKKLQEASFWYEEVEGDEGARFVVLSTCDYGADEQRLIIVAVEQKM